MNIYKCVVYDKNKKKKILKLHAKSKTELNEYADNNNLKIVKIKNSRKIYIKEKINNDEIKIICKQMSILLESGCEMTKTLRILTQESNEKVGNIISKIHNHVQMGNSITESFFRTKLFSNFFINMMRAGEVSGNLDSVLENLADYYEKEAAFKSKTKNILTYPTILTIASIGVTLFTILFIIPNFQMIFENSDINTPIITRIIIDISIFIKEYILYFTIFIVFVVVYSIYYIKTSHTLKFKIDRFVFKIPYVEEIFRIIVAARFSRALHILMKSGIQIVDAIQISSNVLDNEFASERLEIAMEYIKRGNSIGDSLSLASIFPNMFISMIKIGEESGKLDDTLNTINRYYENELDAKTQKFMSFIQPAIIIFLGVTLGSVLISIAMPMFDMVNSI